MQRLQKSSVDPVLCAADVVETIPLVMTIIREIASQQRSSGLTLIQIRAMGILRRFPNASLSFLARHLTLTLSATSRLIDALVDRGLVHRATCPDNRRRISLALSPAGARRLESTIRATTRHMARPLAQLTPADRAAIRHAMTLLDQTFAPNSPGGPWPVTAHSTSR